MTRSAKFWTIAAMVFATWYTVMGWLDDFALTSVLQTMKAQVWLAAAVVIVSLSSSASEEDSDDE